jgi:trigger factor
LIGLNKDAEAEINVDFEDSYSHPKLAGKKIKFKVKIIDIKEMILPELNDEFAQNLGSDLKDFQDLKNKVRETITAQEEKRIDRETKQRLLEKISDDVDFELPQVLVESELDYAVENVKQSIIRSGSNLEKAGLSEAKLRQDFRATSEKRVREMLILGEIADQEKITLDEDDIAEGFKNLAATTGQDPDTLRKYYETRNLLDSLKEKLLEEKTLNYLIEHANIIEVNKDSSS